MTALLAFSTPGVADDKKDESGRGRRGSPHQAGRRDFDKGRKDYDKRVEEHQREGRSRSSNRLASS